MRAVRELEYTLSLRRSAPIPSSGHRGASEKAIEVKADDKKYVLEIRSQLGDPQLARDVLEALLEAYQQKHVDVFDQPGSAAFFEEQVARVTRELAEAQQKLEAFRGEHRVVSLDAEKELLLNQYARPAKLLLQTDREPVCRRAGSPGARPNRCSSPPCRQDREYGRDPSCSSAFSNDFLERNRITENLGPRHPQVVAIHNEISRAAERLTEAIEATRSTTQAKIEDLQLRIEE